MNRTTVKLIVGLAVLTFAGEPRGAAQSFPTDDPIIRAIWEQGMEAPSQAYALAQVLMDSIGPRLTGSPGHQAAVEWLLDTYRQWGIPARAEQYGTAAGWRQGVTHLDLVAPRVRTLEARLLAWSRGTDRPVEGEVALIPDSLDAGALDRWLPTLRGKFVAASFPEPTCRPDENWEQWATPESLELMQAERETARRQWGERLRAVGAAIVRRLDEVGAAGVLTSRWSQGWGVNKVFSAPTRETPALDVSCEDYGLIYRLAQAGQSPRLRLQADAEDLGEVPALNVVGELRGVEQPDEYVLLSAHLDSWHSASGATDNGTGTITMLEAMRILGRVYPRPKRTILVGHWGGEEQGLIGSGAFATDRPAVVRGLQAMFNQDNGTWRIEFIRMQGYTRAGEHFGRWFSKIPREISRHIELDIPGVPETGGSDHLSMICHGAPGFRLQSSYPDYRQYTWHTNRDTFDKVIFDDLKNNATLTAMLAYLASEDPDRLPRDRRILPPDERTGQPGSWPACRQPRRSP